MFREVWVEAVQIKQLKKMKFDELPDCLKRAFNSDTGAFDIYTENQIKATYNK